MIIFGFEIKRHKKKEYEEAKHFERLVYKITTTIDEIKNSLRLLPVHIGEMDYVAMVSNQLIFLDKFCHMYGDYKFSSPSSYLTISSNLRSIPKALEELTDAMLKARSFDESMKEKAADMGIPVQQLFMTNNFAPMINQITGVVKLCCEKLLIIVINISTCLSGDINKIEQGVDLVQDYKERSKLKNDKDVNSYNISFKLMPKEKILSKDENKLNKHS